MLSELPQADADFLLGRPEFRRFLFVAIQSAGVIGQHTLADGPQERDLRFHEGRRSLGFELLQMADLGQPEPLRTPGALATLNAAILEALNPAPKGKSSGRRTDDTARFDELGDE
jgi:hypothetical protein